jgi:hypothetical protein
VSPRLSEIKSAVLSQVAFAPELGRGFFFANQVNRIHWRELLNA